jgi:hypothetical protein
MDEGKFNRLSLADRADMVREQGTFVHAVTFKNYCLMLYSINDQFIELSYDRKAGSILWISLANQYDLSKYLADVHLPV